MADADGVGDVRLEIHLGNDAREPAAPDEGQVGEALADDARDLGAVGDLIAEDAGAGEEQGTESVEKITSLITGTGGEVSGTDVWGKRTLAYPIQKNNEGYYLQANFKIDGSKAQELDRALDADQSVIRHLLVRDDIKPVLVEEAAE